MSQKMNFRLMMKYLWNSPFLPDIWYIFRNFLGMAASSRMRWAQKLQCGQMMTETSWTKIEHKLHENLANSTSKSKIIAPIHSSWLPLMMVMLMTMTSVFWRTETFNFRLPHPAHTSLTFDSSVNFNGIISRVFAGFVRRRSSSVAHVEFSYMPCNNSVWKIWQRGGKAWKLS